VTAAPDEWARCKGWIEAALKYADGAYQIEDIEAAIAAGEMAFLPGPDAAIVLEICAFPRLRALNVLFAGGNLDGVKRMDPLLVDIAKAHGCSLIYLTGRLGWLRTLAPLGYGEIAGMASKEL